MRISLPKSKQGKKMASDFHLPVLCKEAISGLNIKSDSICVDMTLGRAGHSREMLKLLKHGFLYASDKDDTALSYSSSVLSKVSSNFKLYKVAFSQMTEALKKDGVEQADAILFDIGVSSPQFDNPERGFSYRFNGPLDMRMDLEQSLTAEKVINTYSEEQLRDIIYRYGEDMSAPKIAKAIVMARKQKPIKTTFELVDVIKGCLPSFILNKKGHPAKQTFQAIRYEVNDELGELKRGLVSALDFLSIGGRCAIITFNSLEDKTVKDLFKEYAVNPPTNRHLPSLIDQPQLKYRLVTRKPIAPSQEEININPRSESAKLRIIERTRK